ncbi:hypothetical protein PQX77_002154 [Marasmius sp. AFHP31]|nr:hypothetical protein PQX77_002154 [Marasmius sp. AFHP31]
MAQYRPEPPSTSIRPNFTTLANASHVNFKGSPNLNSVGGNQYNYHNFPSEQDPLKQILEEIGFAFYYDCHGRHQSYPPGSTLSRAFKTQVTEELMTWALPNSDNDEEQPKVLWLRGSTGTGKSTIAARLAKLCDDQSELAANFFFSRFNPNLNHPRFLVPALAYGLISSYPDLRDLVYKSIREKTRVLKADLDSQFQQLIAQPLLQWRAAAGGPNTHAKLIVLDGIDECPHTDHQRLVLSMVLSAVTKGLPLRFLICSRSEDHIWEYFSNPSLLAPYTKYFLLDGDLNTNGKVRDILTNGFKKMSSGERFLQMNLSDPWPPIRGLETLVEKASGETDFANTVIRFLEHHPHPQEQLEAILSLPTSYADRLRALSGQNHGLTMAQPGLAHVNSISMPPALSQPLDSTSVHANSPDEQVLNAASSSLYHHIVYSTYGGNESCVYTLVAIALLHANPALIPHIPVTPRTLESLLQTPQGAILGAIGSCLRTLQGPDDEIVAYHPSFFRFLLDLDKQSGRRYCLYLINAWFNFMSDGSLEQIISIRERYKVLDAVLLGWSSFRLEIGIQTLFLQKIISINLTKLFTVMLRSSWHTASLREWTSGDPETIGVSTLYRQIEDLIPWLEGLDSSPQAPYLLARLRRSQRYFCITPPLEFAGSNDYRLRWIVMQIAGCKWKCGVTEKARNSFKSSTNASTSSMGELKVISVGGWEPCQKCSDPASRYTTAHYRIDIRPWCILIANDLRDEIRQNSSPEACANLAQSSLLPLCFADPLPESEAEVNNEVAQTNTTTWNSNQNNVQPSTQTQTQTAPSLPQVLSGLPRASDYTDPGLQALQAQYQALMISSNNQGWQGAQAMGVPPRPN